MERFDNVGLMAKREEITGSQLIKALKKLAARRHDAIVDANGNM